MIFFTILGVIAFYALMFNIGMAIGMCWDCRHYLRSLLMPSVLAIAAVRAAMAATPDTTHGRSA